ncbi:YciI family protein [uncultured Pseudodesulfovibrio sp.]|uniref:YciI family protein n=1 Tax=uncultured Pseudodesulfovibrio sp. TaxID=2035858 RepID=UPI0029C778B0|nr:YciI family protein [uncultured Pseudodesulfovibrio sp.]
MFIVTLTYVVSLETVDSYLDEHIAFLKQQYAEGVFLASGRKVPRTGGVILARSESEEKLNAVLEQDPFKRNGVAEYSVAEFVPSMTADGLEGLLEQ